MTVITAAVLAAALCACGKKEKETDRPAAAASETVTGMVTAVFDENRYKIRTEIDYTESSEVVSSDVENPDDYEAHITNIDCSENGIVIQFDFRNNSGEQCALKNGDFFINGYEVSAYVLKKVDAGASETFTIRADAYEFNAEEICRIAMDLEIHTVLEKNTYYSHKPFEVIRCTAVTDKADAYEFKGRKDKDTDIVIEDNAEQKIVIIGKQFVGHGDDETSLYLYYYVENRMDDMIFYSFDDIRVNGKSPEDEEDGFCSSFISPHKACIGCMRYDAPPSFFQENEDFRLTAVLSTKREEPEKSENKAGRWVHKSIEDLITKNINLYVVK